MRLFRHHGRVSVSAEAAQETWRKSSYSYVNGNCIEVAGTADGLVTVRDSQDPSGPTLAFGRARWDAFIDDIRDGRHDHQRR
jgi:hypothetical protein